MENAASDAIEKHLAPEEMEKRFVAVCERAMTTTVNDIEHIESQSYNGVASRCSTGWLKTAK